MNVRAVIQRYNIHLLILFDLFCTGIYCYWRYWNNHLQVFTNIPQIINIQGMRIDFMIIVYWNIDKEKTANVIILMILSLFS